MFNESNWVDHYRVEGRRLISFNKLCVFETQDNLGTLLVQGRGNADLGLAVASHMLVITATCPSPQLNPFKRIKLNPL